MNETLAQVGTSTAAGHAGPTGQSLEQAIIDAPGNGVPVANFLDFHTKEVGAKAALERLASLQDRVGTPLAAVLFRLEQTYKNAGVRERFAALLSSAAADPLMTACETVWQDHIYGRPLDRDACRLIKADKAKLATVYFSFIAAPLSQYSALAPNDRQAAAIEAAGIDLSLLGAAIEAFARFGSREWEAVIAKARYASEAIAEDVASKERYSSTKDRIVSERRLRFIDPMTGQWIEPYDSFLFNGKAIYAFAGQQTFYLIYAYLGVEPCGLYLPAHDLVLSLTSQIRGALAGEQIANIRAAILRRMARMPAAYEAAATGPGDTRLKEIVLIVGRTENFAHHMWNFYAALERLVVSGGYRNVDTMITGGTQFFGPIPELFPEFQAAIWQHDPKDYSDPRPFRKDSLVVPTGSNYIPATLSRRIIDAMRRRPRVAEAIEPGDVSAGGPIVWIGMRLGDKSWVDQESDIPVIIAKIGERYPDALFLLDGFSFPVGADQISGAWAGVIAELNRIAESIRAASPDPDRVLNLVGNTLRENVLWADTIDVYLAPLGSTQHKVGWFTDAPGIVYAPPMYGDGKAERTVGNWAVEISGPITWLIGRPVSPGARRGARDSRTRMQNVELDTPDIAERMLALLTERERRKGWRAVELGLGGTGESAGGRPDGATREHAAVIDPEGRDGHDREDAFRKDI